MRQIVSLLVIISVFFFYAPIYYAFAAGTIAFDNSSQRHQDAGGGTTSTWSHTTTGSNRLLVVGCEIGAGNTASGATYNGSSMTLINTQALGGATFSNVYLWYLIAPTTGANNIVVTASASTFIYCAATSYTGVNQSSPLDVNNTGSNGSGNASASVTTTVNNDWLVGYFSAGATNGSSWTNGSNTTLRVTDNSTGFWYSMGDSNADQTPAGSFSLNATRSPSSLVGANIVAIKPTNSGGIIFNPYLFWDF